MKYVSYNKDNTVKVISSTSFSSNDENVIPISEAVELYSKVQLESDAPIKIAYVCNWNQKCGISTYSKFLFDELQYLVQDYKIFSEQGNEQIEDEKITYCWKRGESLRQLTNSIEDYKPSLVLIQHEWGLFPNASYFMKFILDLDKLNIPHLVILHSVYEHLDKTIPLSVLKNVVVHSPVAKEVLKKIKFPGKITVIPHGCPAVNEDPELWNVFQNPYTVFGYGFGFKYKGVDMAIDAVNHLVKNDPKFKNLLYIYVCSESENNKGIHNAYFDSLNVKVKELDLEDNIILIKGFLSDELLSNYLRIVKLCIFPYISETNNVVYGASGAIKIAMSYNIPVIGSVSHLFDDLEGVVPRIYNYLELVSEIDKIFSDHTLRIELIKKNHDYLTKNSWKNSSLLYLEEMKRILG